MTDDHRTKQTNAEKLEEERQEEAEEHLGLTSPVVYEVIRQEGEEELNRPIKSLWWSGVAAGMAISSSLLAEGLLHHYLPDAPWRPVVENFGYTIGFLIVILGRLQLFTENTITAVLPVLAEKSRRNLLRTARLWGVVLAANFVGTFLFATLVTFGSINPAEHVTAMLDVSRHFSEKSALESLMHGIPAGFLVAAIVWILPNAESSKFWIVLTITYLIALGDFAHVIVGSSEVFLLLLGGELSITKGFLELLGPALIGNIIGGTGLFALLAYAQVQDEI